MEDLITIKEFCDYFKISKPTFYEWKKSGKVKVMKIGRVIRIRKEELEKIKRGEWYDK